MKLSQYILLCFVIMLAFSCKQQPECNSIEAIELAKALLIDHFKNDFESEFSLKELNGGNNIENFINENIIINDFRTTSKTADLQICDCSSNITFTFSEEFISKLNEQSKNNIIISAFAKKIKTPIAFNFKLQITEDNSNQYIEGIIPSEEIRAIYTVYALLNVKNKQDAVQEPENETIDNSSIEPLEGDVSTQDSSKKIIVISDKALIFNSANISDKTKMYLIKGDVSELLIFDEKFCKMQFITKTGRIIEGYVLTSDIQDQND